MHGDCALLMAWGKEREWEGRSVLVGVYVYVRRGLAVEEKET